MTRYWIYLILLLLPTLSGCTAAPAYTGERSTNFDGTRFVNSDPMDKSAGDFVKLAWGAVTESQSWPAWVDTVSQQVPVERVYGGISITFINHATFLIQVDGLNILTDPIYSQRASPFQWAGPRRVHAPGIALADLPPIDLVLISHNHYDHLDEDTLVQLARQQEIPPLILSGLGNGLLFDKLGLPDHRDMDWDDKLRIGDLEVVFLECRHRSGRGIGDQMKTLWGSFVIKTGEGNIYFAGDTGYGPHLKEAGERFGPFSLALLPIGAYEPRWFMSDVHLNPAEAVQAHLDLRSEHSVAMHFGTFQLTYEGVDEPVIDLFVALQRYGIHPGRFDVLEVGETSYSGFRLETAQTR
jgi:L-ascorbate metabolism protein UlaG (beta-lactamase superfamily)